MPRSIVMGWLIVSLSVMLIILGRNAQAESSLPPLSAAQQTALAAVQKHQETILSINRQLWEYAELGLQEHRSSRLLAEILQREGFRVHKGVADLPTAFVATFGVGSPVIGLLAEYDALPELSQTTAPEREPVKAGNPGHGCGHSGLGAGACGAALAIKEALQLHRLPGTIKLYGTPAEESLIGKVYMLRAGLFSDLDVCLHWHPANRNEVWAGSSKAAVSAKFRFYGAAAHAAGAPHRGRSALDGVELMNIGVNFMREHVKEDARIHYVITAGGGAPNVIPAFAEVWYYVRADQHHDVEHYFEWLQEIARGAAMMSRTKCEIAIETDCHELLSNTPLAEVMMRNLLRINPPTYTAEEQAWAGRLLSNTPDAPADRDFILDHRIHKLPAGTEHSKGSTDVGDISWHVPTIGLRTTCFPNGLPGHAWQNVAAIRTSIGEKGIIYASEVLAATAIELLENPGLIHDARKSFEESMKSRAYRSLIPPQQSPPRSLR